MIQLTSIDHDALHEVGVFENAVSQQQVFRAHWDPFSRRVDNSAMEAVDFCCGSIHLNIAPELAGLEFRLLKT